MSLKKIANVKGRKTLFLIILSLGIGFSVLSTSLYINGGINLFANDWNIYLDNIEVSSGSVNADTPTINNKTTVNYEVNLSKPGDFYEFTVEAINDGSIDALVSLVENTTLSNEISNLMVYTITYEDGSEIQENDLLAAKKKLKYKIHLAYKTDIIESDLMQTNNRLHLSFTLVYTTSGNKIVKETSFTKIVKDSVLTDSELDFTKISSDTNGKGLYVRSGTENDDYPIYYYRGNVTNNYAKFAGYCWKIVRTTETGGTKLIYTGTPRGDGSCSGMYTIGNSVFNTFTNSPASLGYMYGTKHEIQSKSSSSNYVYGNDFSYENAQYTLLSTKIGADNAHHYTCFTSGTTCEKLYYVYNVSNNTAYYLTLTEGKNIDDILQEANTNTNDSEIKTIIDNWFQNSVIPYFLDRGQNYSDYIEDTIWCNDRSVPEDGMWNSYGGTISASNYNTVYRLTKGTPTIKCPNKNDSFTVTESASGNGALTYPVGLLTADEVMLAGNISSDSSNNSLYLFMSTTWWTMSPHYLKENARNYQNYYYYYHYCAPKACTNCSPVCTTTAYYNLKESGNDASLDVRPSISVASNVKVKSGTTGTASNPYEFIVNEQ